MANQESTPHAACPLCGGTELIDGHMNAAHGIGFSPGPETFWRKLFGAVEKVTAAKCQSCGHLLLFANPLKSTES